MFSILRKAATLLCVFLVVLSIESSALTNDELVKRPPISFTTSSGLTQSPSSGMAAGNDALDKAGVLVIMLDNSGSSPSTDKSFVEAAWPTVEKALRAMDMGSTVILVSVGDARLKPMNMSVRIQARDNNEGKSIDRVVAAVKQVVLGFPAQTQGQEHGNSQIIGGFFDASHVINRKSTNNRIVALTDLIENSPLANCYINCKLPTPTFDLVGTSVTVLGVGRGLHSNKEMAVFASWEKFFTKTGANFDLKKTF
jgi:hypothetical protein